MNAFLHYHLFVVNIVVFKAIFKWFLEKRSIFYILKMAFKNKDEMISTWLYLLCYMQRNAL